MFSTILTTYFSFTVSVSRQYHYEQYCFSFVLPFYRGRSRSNVVNDQIYHVFCMISRGFSALFYLNIFISRKKNGVELQMNWELRWWLSLSSITGRVGGRHPVSWLYQISKTMHSHQFMTINLKKRIKLRSTRTDIGPLTFIVQDVVQW